MTRLTITLTYRPLKAVDREFDIGFLGFPVFPGIGYFCISHIQPGASWRDPFSKTCISRRQNDMFLQKQAFRVGETPTLWAIKFERWARGF